MRAGAKPGSGDAATIGVPGGGAHRLSVNMQHAAGVRRRGAEENVALTLQPRVALRREPNHEVAAGPRRPRPADLHVRRALRHTIRTRCHCSRSFAKGIPCRSEAGARTGWAPQSTTPMRVMSSPPPSARERGGSFRFGRKRLLAHLASDLSPPSLGGENPCAGGAVSQLE